MALLIHPDTTLESLPGDYAKRDVQRQLRPNSLRLDPSHLFPGHEVGWAGNGSDHLDPNPVASLLANLPIRGLAALLGPQDLPLAPTVDAAVHSISRAQRSDASGRSAFEVAEGLRVNFEGLRTARFVVSVTGDAALDRLEWDEICDVIRVALTTIALDNGAQTAFAEQVKAS